VEFCPLQVLSLSHEYNAKGYHPVEVSRPERCVDCDLCEIICPDFAIFCLNEVELGETPAPAAVEEAPVER
jgi:2-oxoglutarate ferredoxin oxidoreductase subunit delta